MAVVAEARQLMREIQASHRRAAAEKVYRDERIDRLRRMDEAEVADADRIGSAHQD